MEEQKEVTFQEAQGLESNKHAKKLAKEKSKKAKEQKIAETFYSQNGNKIVSVKIKKSGSYQAYVGSLSKKKEAAILKLEIEKWKKAGLWVEQHQLKEFCKKKLEELK